jgi:hypothetical protein
MIEKFEDLGLNKISKGLEKEELREKLNSLLRENLNISLVEMEEALNVALVKQAEELTLDLPNIAPFNDYQKLLEDNDQMAEFLKTQAAESKNWDIFRIELDVKELLKFSFHNLAVDDGTSLIGLVFVSKGGKIRHAFSVVDL